MSALQTKYQDLIQAANTAGIKNLNISEQDNVLRINGEAPDTATKDKLWGIYGKLDPNFRSSDLVMDLTVAASAGSSAKVITESSNLNIRKGPSTDDEVIGKAAHNEIVTVVNKANDQWWLIRTKDGEEGYAYAQYLSPQ